MSKIKDIDPKAIDNTMGAISSVFKAIVCVARAIDSFKQTGNKNELTGTSAV